MRNKKESYPAQEDSGDEIQSPDQSAGDFTDDELLQMQNALMEMVTPKANAREGIAKALYRPDPSFFRPVKNLNSAKLYEGYDPSHESGLHGQGLMDVGLPELVNVNDLSKRYGRGLIREK